MAVMDPQVQQQDVPLGSSLFSWKDKGRAMLVDNTAVLPDG